MFLFFSSRRRHARFDCDWSSDVCSNEWLNGGLEILHTNVGASEVEERLRVVGLLSDCLVKRCYCFVVSSGIGIHDADLVIVTRKLWFKLNGPLQLNNCLLVLYA